MVTVKRMSAEDNSYTLDPVGYTVRLYYASNGREAFLDDPVAPFVFENVPQGIHAIVVLRMKIGPADGRGPGHHPGVRERRHEARGVHVPAVAGPRPRATLGPSRPGRNRPGGFAVFDPLRVRGPGADPGVPGG